MTARSSVANGCSLFSDESTEKMGTMMNCVHHGNGWRYHGKDDGRKQPCVMSCRTIGVEGVKVNDPARASFSGMLAEESAM